MVKSLFVTATGTDIGKTYVSGLLVKKMREYGLDCGYFKPVLSGAVMENGELTPGDCKFVVDTAGLNCKPLDCLSYCFEEAVSPHLASSRQGVVISADKILADYKAHSQKYDYVLIEGAGGITCPLSVEEDKIFLLSDLVKLMGTDVLLVADGGLGTINSILTSIEYIRNRGIKIAGIILNNFDNDSFMHRDNKEMVERLTNIRVVAIVGKDEKDIEISKQDLEVLFKEV